MNRLILKTRQCAFARSVLLAAIFLLPVLWSNQANADLFDSLKKAAEKALGQEIENAIGNDADEQQATQTLPDTAVLQTQVYLSYLGYNPGLINGLLTRQTLNAIKAFQRDVGMRSDGVVTAQLAARLLESYQRYAITGQKPGSTGAGSNQPVPQTSPPVYSPAPQTQVQTPAQAQAQTATQSQSSAGSGSTFGQLTPTAVPVFDQESALQASGNNAYSVPAQWSTVENGIVVPHPVTVDGRLLSVSGIEHYAKWMGLGDPTGAKHALAEYLQLISIGVDPNLISRLPFPYALYLTTSERAKYLCWQPSSSCRSMSGEMVWTGSNEFEKRRSIQNFISDYRDRFVAIAPKLPIELLDIGEARVSQYDTNKHGFTITSSSSLGVNFVFGVGPHHLENAGIHFENPSPRFRFDRKSEGSPNRYALGVEEFWSADTAQAESIIDRLWSTNNADRKVVTRFHQTITDIEIAPPPVSSPATANVQVTSGIAYEDPLFERAIYRFGLGGEGSAASEFSATTSLVATEAATKPDTNWKDNGPMNLVEAAAGDYGLAPVDIPMIRGVPAITIYGPKVSEQKHNFGQLFGRERTAERLHTLRIGLLAELMTKEARVEYMVEPRWKTRSSWTWVGTNEIEKARTREKFIENVKPRLAAAGPSAPFDMWIILPARMGNYDFTRSGFPLDGLPTRHQDFVLSLGRNFRLPGEFLNVSPDAAEKMVESLQPHRSVYVGILFEVSSWEYFKTKDGHTESLPESGLSLSGVIVHPRLKSMGLFADEKLTQQIYRFN